MKKKVAIMITNLSGGGAQRVSSNLSLYLPEDKYEKQIILFDASKIEYPYKGNLFNLETEASTNLFRKAINFIKRLYKINAIKKKCKIDITISLLPGPNIINILTKGNDKVIVSVRNYVSKSSSGFYGKLYNLLMKFLYNRADLIVVVSEAIKSDLVNNFGLYKNKIKIIYNLYDIEKIRELAEQEIDHEHKCIFKKPTITTAGRLSKQKGQWHLIRAFKKVKKELPEAKLVILGKGELENYLKELTIGLGLEKDIHFIGFQANPFKYIAKSTIYVFPSLYEGFPNAMCEAMACGIPVVAADCQSGPREIIAPSTDINSKLDTIEYAEYGILVPVCDGVLYSHNDELTRHELTLCKSITDIMKNQERIKKYAHNSIKRVKDFNKESIIEIWKSVL